MYSKNTTILSLSQKHITKCYFQNKLELFALKKGIWKLCMPGMLDMEVFWSLTNCLVRIRNISLVRGARDWKIQVPTSCVQMKHGIGEYKVQLLAFKWGMGYLIRIRGSCGCCCSAAVAPSDGLVSRQTIFGYRPFFGSCNICIHQGGLNRVYSGLVLRQAICLSKVSCKIFSSWNVSFYR